MEPARIAPYTLELTLDEAQAVTWLADRYSYAQHLYEAMRRTEAGYQVALTEPDAWAFRDAVEAEDGWLPCCGGTLADKITALLERIV